MGFGVWGLGLRVWGSGFDVQGLGGTDKVRPSATRLQRFLAPTPPGLSGVAAPAVKTFGPLVASGGGPACGVEAAPP